MTKNESCEAGSIALRVTLVGLIALAVPGCGPDNATASRDSPPDESTAPTFEQFLAEAHVLEDGRLVIDQDILVADEQAARAYYEQEMDRSRQQRLTVYSVNGADVLWTHPQRMELTYCVDTASFGANANLLLTTLEEAAYSWSRRVGVSFRRVQVATCNNATTGVVFNVRQQDMSAFASAFFPNWSRQERELLVAPAAFTTNAGGRDLLGILGHELGHAIGLRHEHIWLSCTSETSSDARQVTTYDSNSIMHYPQCRPSGTGGYRQSDLDYSGTHTLYGMAPALISITY